MYFSTRLFAHQVAQVFSLCYNMVTVSVLVSWRNGQLCGWMQAVRIFAGCYLLSVSEKLNSDSDKHLARNQFLIQVCGHYRTGLGASSYHCNLTPPPVTVSQHFWFADLGRLFSSHEVPCLLLHQVLSCSHFLFSSLNVFDDPLSSLRVQNQHVENCRSAGLFPFGREQLLLSV